MVLMSIVTIMMSWKNQNKKFLLESTHCYIELNYNNEKIKLRTLIDTGHDVKTIFGENVVFVKNDLKLKGGVFKNRKVSYKTISGIEERYGVKVENIKIEYNNRIISKDAVVVSTPNIIQNYDAIASLDLIEGGM